MKAPRISVIIPTYNRGYVVGKAVESAVLQTVPVDEIIVVDDGSTDNTAEVLSRFGEKITVIRQVNQGVSAARNAGIERATGDWITFLDSDDIWSSDRVLVLKRDIFGTDAGVHVSNIELVGMGYRYNYFQVRGYKFPRDNAERHDNGFILWVKTPMMVAFAARRDWILQVGGFDTAMRIREDYDLMAKLMTLGPWLVTSAVVCHVRRFPGSESSLSSIARTEPLYTRSIEVKLFERVLSSGMLNREQFDLVRRRLSSSRFELAGAMARQSNRGKARAQLLLSAREHPTLKGWVRALPALIFGDAGYRLAQFGRRTLSRQRPDAVGRALQFR